jgi:hypothetical protein
VADEYPSTSVVPISGGTVVRTLPSRVEVEEGRGAREIRWYLRHERRVVSWPVIFSAILCGASFAFAHVAITLMLAKVLIMLVGFRVADVYAVRVEFGEIIIKRPTLLSREPCDIAEVKHIEALRDGGSYVVRAELRNKTLRHLGVTNDAQQAQDILKELRRAIDFPADAIDQRRT